MPRIMELPTAMESASREEVLGAMAEVMERQARVARAEAALEAARRRLGESVERLSRISAARGQDLELPRLAAALAAESVTPANGAGTTSWAGTLRERIMAVMEASPEDVHTPASLAPLVGSQNRDSVRNTLLVLAAKGRIEKRGAGRYQARRGPFHDGAASDPIPRAPVEPFHDGAASDPIPRAPAEALHDGVSGSAEPC